MLRIILALLAIAGTSQAQVYNRVNGGGGGSIPNPITSQVSTSLVTATNAVILNTISTTNLYASGTLFGASTGVSNSGLVTIKQRTNGATSLDGLLVESPAGVSFRAFCDSTKCVLNRSGQANHMTLASSGQVGIGVATANAALEVSGTVSSTQLGVNGYTLKASGTNLTMGSPVVTITSTNNTAFGFQTLTSNTVGATGNMTAFGYQALRNANTGPNTAFGYQAGSNITTAANNTAVGSGALAATTTQGGNTAVGANALLSVSDSTSTNNVAVGYGAMASATTGTNNVYIGYSAGNNAVRTDNQVAVGALAMQLVSGSGPNDPAKFNNAIGFSALKGGATVVSNSGDSNNAFGYNAGTGITTGSSNTLIGHNAGSTLTTGSSNLLIGFNVQTPGNSATVNNWMNIQDTISGSYASGGSLTVAVGTQFAGPVTATTLAAGSKLVNGMIYNGPYVYATTSQTYTFPNTGPTIVTLSTVLSPTLYLDPSSTITSKGTISPTAGIYYFNAGVRATVSASVVVSLYVKKGTNDSCSTGAQTYALWGANNQTAVENLVRPTVSGMVNVNSGEYVCLFLEHNSPGSLPVTSGATDVFFNMFRIKE